MSEQPTTEERTPETCPTCGSDDPAVIGMQRVLCRDPIHEEFHVRQVQAIIKEGPEAYGGVEPGTFHDREHAEDAYNLLIDSYGRVRTALDEARSELSQREAEIEGWKERKKDWATELTKVQHDRDSWRRRAESAEQRLTEATAFTFVPNNDPKLDYDAVTVERVYRHGWPERDAAHPHPAGEWAIKRSGYRLNRDRTWEYEPIPSSRDEDFYRRTCFERDEAIELARSTLNALSEESE